MGSLMACLARGHHQGLEMEALPAGRHEDQVVSQVTGTTQALLPEGGNLAGTKGYSDPVLWPHGAE